MISSPHSSSDQRDTERIPPTLLANHDAIFQHNNAPTHSAYIVQGLLRETNLTIIDWPLYSPNLNLIESLWALLKANILKLWPWLRDIPKNENTWGDLVYAAQEAWEKLTIRHFVNLAETMPHRMEEVIKYEGSRVPVNIIGTEPPLNITQTETTKNKNIQQHA
ncbi:hypothetical protein N7447_004255 [Penicillium robsamsonii]|uniref:uncharacterized protein n=1 Tax=Penicillium robsamsonii TaxID=1792511 RepID=UPI002549500C|nr:uncharacterized protein N7447_004255 [Penicillium robsamsonii]KAJ5827492.1 hypothetical protein N7447_004255 [Penicillium robsamsonii]